MANKPRILLGPKDLVWSLVPLVLLCLGIAAVAGRCSLSPGGPRTGAAPSFNAHAALRSDAASLSFPIREPKLPEGWQPNSGSRDTLNGTGGGRVTTVGYLTPAGRYLAYTQSDASVPALARSVNSGLTATDSRRVADRTWMLYTEPGAEAVWVSDFGDVRVLLHGAGTQAEYSTLAAAVAAASPLAK